VPDPPSKQIQIRFAIENGNRRRACEAIL